MSGSFQSQWEFLQGVVSSELPNKSCFKPFLHWTRKRRDIFCPRNYERKWESINSFTPNNICRFLENDGEKFTPEEMEEMLGTIVDPNDQKVHFEDYVNMLT